MTHDDLTARLRVTFLQELAEQVHELNSALLALEQGSGGADLVRTLFRAAHTIKGAASVAGVPLVEQVCHVLESVFAGVRDGEYALTGSDFSLLFAVLDALSDAGTRLREGATLDATPLDALLPRLATLAAAAGTPATKPPPRTPPAPDASSETAAAAAAPRQRDADRGDRTDAGEGLVRVRADRLDTLLSAVGELIIATGRVADRSGGQDEDARRLTGVTGRVADVVRHLRLRPFADVCEALPRAVRDIAAGQGKRVDLELAGQDVEADRLVMDALRDPLLHLVRNAVDHGIEVPDVRAERGKPPAGIVRVAAELTGGRLVVTVADDGAGLDESAIRSALQARGRAVPRNRNELADALLTGAFSTRAEATSISGRGVGVDLARSAVERIGGSIDVDWEPDRGTTFTVQCPPTPATIRALLVRLGAHTFAIPTTQVERLRRIRQPEIRTAQGRMLLATPVGPIPVHALAALLGPPLETRALEDTTTVVVVAVGARRAALVVDEVLDEREIVVRPLDLDDGALPYATGAAILPSGRIALVLGAAALLVAGARAGTAIAPAFAQPRVAPRTRVLVADDSITTRMLEQSVLEAAGYEVITAVDGEDAWQQLDREGADVVIADIEMPKMDGFTLCRRIRATHRFADLPVILVTGLSADADRARGLEAGADAYIVKSSLDQAMLIDAVQQFVGDP